MNIIIATTKSWNIDSANRFKEENANKYNTFLITDKKDLIYCNVNRIQPRYIFFPHWSWIIPKEIFFKFNCIVFHMTDLPFGRGGSPLQNLIARGVENTKISAIKADNKIDAGDIYLKRDLNLNGTAEEILIRASKIIFNDMIPEIISNNLQPRKQMGKVVEFKRRRTEQSEIKPKYDLQKIYDYIRMLDGEGYPKAFIKFGKYKLEFSRASYKNGKIIADVEIKEGEYND